MRKPWTSTLDATGTDDSWGVIENAPRPTEIIRSEFGTMGNVVYMELSALSHGGVSSLLSRMTPIAASTGSTWMSPGGEAEQLPILATVLPSTRKANGRRLKLFGWDAERWNAWRRWAAPSLRQLIHGPPGASE
jgi:hypothetical protein